MQESKFVITIPSVNRIDLIRRNWLPYADKYQIIISCPDEEIASIQSLSKRFIAISDGEALGAGAARAALSNYLIEKKLYRKYEVIFTGDDDAKSKDDFQRVANLVASENVIIGPKWNFDRKNTGLIERDNVGVLWAFPSRLLKEIGGFDPEFIAFEDREFQIRARWAGVNTYSDTSWIVNHTRHQPGGLRGDLYSLSLTYKLFEKKYPGLLKPVYAKDGSIRAMRRDRNWHTS